MIIILFLRYCKWRLKLFIQSFMYPSCIHDVDWRIGGNMIPVYDQSTASYDNNIHCSDSLSRTIQLKTACDERSDLEIYKQHLIRPWSVCKVLIHLIFFCKDSVAMLNIESISYQRSRDRLPSVLILGFYHTNGASTGWVSR